MQFFLWLAFLVVIGVAIFMVQNSTAPSVLIKYLLWSFETTLIYTILVSIGSGMLIILFLWIPRSIKASFREKNLKKEIEILERQMKPQGEASKPLENPQR
jgi:putative membrane protein